MMPVLIFSVNDYNLTDRSLPGNLSQKYKNHFAVFVQFLIDIHVYINYNAVRRSSDK